MEEKNSAYIDGLGDSLKLNWVPARLLALASCALFFHASPFQNVFIFFELAAGNSSCENYFVHLEYK